MSEEAEMKDKVAQRLALLEGISLSPADLEWIASEIEDLQRVVAELEEFGRDTPWTAMQVQPPDKKF
jgi:hypothetical protein